MEESEKVKAYDFALAETLAMFRAAVQRTARYEDAMYETTDEDEQARFNRWRKYSLMEESTLFDVLSFAFNMHDDELEGIASSAKRDR